MSSFNIIIGIVGHQSIEQEMNLSSRDKVTNHLSGLRKKHSDSMMLLVPFSFDFESNMRIIKIAQELDIGYAIILPVDKEAYMGNIHIEMRDEFIHICESAEYVQNVRLYPGISLKTYFLYDMDKRYQNFVCQKAICEKSNEILALWDGVIDYKIGSVSDAIRIRKKEFSKPITTIFTQESFDKKVNFEESLSSG